MLEVLDLSEGCDGQGASSQYGFDDGSGFGDGLRAGDSRGGGRSYIVNMAYGEGNISDAEPYLLDAVDLLIRLSAREAVTRA